MMSSGHAGKIDVVARLLLMGQSEAQAIETLRKVERVKRRAEFLVREYYGYPEKDAW